MHFVWGEIIAQKVFRFQKKGLSIQTVWGATYIYKCRLLAECMEEHTCEARLPHIIGNEE